jgi:hypothetical protein
VIRQALHGMLTEMSPEEFIDKWPRGHAHRAVGRPGALLVCAYIAEFQLQYNNRSNEDIFGEAISGC